MPKSEYASQASLLTNPNTKTYTLLYDYITPTGNGTCMYLAEFWLSMINLSYLKICKVLTQFFQMWVMGNSK